MAAGGYKIYTDAAKTTEATPQQIYDAYMSGTVMLDFGTSDGTGSAANVVEIDYEGTPDNILGVMVWYAKNGNLSSITVGGN